MVIVVAATTFDVGGYKLAAEVSGEGAPTVVFVSGGGDDGEPRNAVIPALRSSTSSRMPAPGSAVARRRMTPCRARSVQPQKSCADATGGDSWGTQGFPEVFLPIVVQSGRYSSRGTAFACAISR